MKEEQKLNEPHKPKLDIFGVIYRSFKKFKEKYMNLSYYMVCFMMTIVSIFSIGSFFFGLFLGIIAMLISIVIGTIMEMVFE